jgi:flagellar hook-length control protein FliK
MPGANLNILDLLLGSAPTSNETALSGAEAGKVPNFGFDALLGSFLRPKSDLNVLAKNVASEETLPGSSVAERFASLLEDVPAQWGVDGNTAGVRLALEIPTGQTAESDPDGPVDLWRSPTEFAVESSSNPTAIDPVLSDSPAGVGFESRQIIFRSTDVREGSYEILKVAAHGDQIELTLAPSGSKQTEIKLFVPQNVFDDALMATADHNRTATDAIHARISKPVFGDESRLLTSLFDALRVKEIHVTKVAQATAGSAEASDEVSGPSNAKLALELSGNKQGEPVILQTTVQAERVRMHIRQSPSAANERLADITVDDRISTAVSSEVSDQRGAQQNGSNSFRSFAWQRPLEFGSRLGFEGPVNADRSMDSAAAALKTDVALDDSALGKQNGLPARVLLPENVDRLLKPDGRAVTLKLEPENLGPARVHLSLHQGALTARVTVESPAAQIAVESSLDQLHAQLDKAGIKVDHIDVNVAGGDADARQFAHSSGGRMRRHITRLSDGELEQLEGAHRAPAALRFMPQQAGPHGVNIYA